GRRLLRSAHAHAGGAGALRALRHPGPARDAGLGQHPQAGRRAGALDLCDGGPLTMLGLTPLNQGGSMKRTVLAAAALAALEAAAQTAPASGGTLRPIVVTPTPGVAQQA